MKYFLFILIIGLILTGCERPTDIDHTGDGIPPSVPERLRVYFAGDGEITIEWLRNREVDVKGYNIYRRTPGTEYAFIDFTDTDFYFDDSLDYDTTYYYRISAVDYSDLESSMSNEVSAIPLNKFPPGIPNDLNINAQNWEGEKCIYLSWASPIDTDLKGYKIYRAEVPGFTPDSTNFLAFTESTEYKDLQAAELYKYYYYIIQSVDKGELLSKISPEVSDRIYDMVELYHPANNTTVFNFRSFAFSGIAVPAKYRLIVQSNLYFDIVWEHVINSTATLDTIKVDVPRGVLYYNTTYYWRVAAYSGENQPNSISGLNKFIIKQ